MQTFFFVAMLFTFMNVLLNLTMIFQFDKLTIELKIELKFNHSYIGCVFAVCEPLGRAELALSFQVLIFEID